jgi:hypothetical protein
MATGRLGWGGDLTPLVGHRTCLPLDETSRPVDTTPTRRGCLCLLAPVGCDLGHVEGGAERGSASVRARSALGQGTSDNRGQQWSPNVSQIRSSLPGCREPSGLLPARRWSPKTTLTVGSGWNQRCNRIPGSSSAAVPPACHSPRSWPVPSGPPRTTTKHPRPAPFPILAGGNSARSGFGSRWSVSRAQQDEASFTESTGQLDRRSDEPDRLVAETGCPRSVGSKERRHNRILHIAWRADRIERKQ